MYKSKKEGSTPGTSLRQVDSFSFERKHLLSVVSKSQIAKHVNKSHAALAVVFAWKAVVRKSAHEASRLEGQLRDGIPFELRVHQSNENERDKGY